MTVTIQHQSVQVSTFDQKYDSSGVPQVYTPRRFSDARQPTMPPTSPDAIDVITLLDIRPETRIRLVVTGGDRREVTYAQLEATVCEAP
jgi:hypothetical protein